MSARPAGLAQAYSEFADEDAAIAAKKKEIDARSVDLTARAAALEKRKAELKAEIALKKAAAAEVEEPPADAPPLGWASRPADVIARHPHAKREMKDATVLITGPTSGIGVHTAEALAGFAGRVVLAARSEEKAQSLIADIRTRVPSAHLSFIPLELASLASVDACATSLSI